MTSTVYSRTLQKAAELIGSRQKLARHLRVPMGELEKWLAASAVPPMGTFLKAVDLVIEETAPPGADASAGGSDPGEPPAPRECAAFRRSC